MVNTKKKRQTIVYKYIIYLYLLLFPFGQLLRLKYSFDSYVIRLQPIDLVAAASAAIYIFGQLKENRVFRAFLKYLFVASFSLTLSLTLFSPKQVLVGSLYLFRLFAYSTLFLLTIKNINEKLIRKRTLVNCLIIATLVIAIIGWVQYFALPDVRFLRAFGWDDHYFRIIGSFFDPTFVGILLVFGFITTASSRIPPSLRVGDRAGGGFIISTIAFIKKWNKWKLVVALFLLVSILFTYARAVYLALLAGTVVILYFKNKLKWFVFIGLGFLFLLFILPRPPSEGVKLERIHSILQKKDNYNETLQIVKKHPVFGVGYNNLCSARLKYVGDIGYGSHSCSGSDSSILLILSTTGILGLLVFISFIITLYVQLKKSEYRVSFLACSAALFTHSLFVNSLFYPWVLGYLAILYAVVFVEGEGSTSST
jgi:hypothetical protein